MASHSSQTAQKDNHPSIINFLIEDKKEAPINLQASFELLNKYRNQVKRFRNDEPCNPSPLKEKPNTIRSGSQGSNSNHRLLSAESIMRIARNRILQPKSQKPVEYLSPENEMYLNLALCLLTAAEKFSLQQYDQAEELLIRVLSASRAGHPVERLVTCFGEDLRMKIYLQKGKTVREQETFCMDVEKAVMNLKVPIRMCEQRLAISQVTHFTGIQMILDSVSSAERIHFVDVGIKLGSYWIILMHALANRENVPLKLLKITAICTSKDMMEETGELLSSFAETMNLPFEFKRVYSEMNEIKKDMFDLEADEVLVVYLQFCLISLSASPPKLEALIREIKNLNPNMMVVSEIEANVNGSTFIDRFHEALFLCSAVFDSLEACLERDNEYRKSAEEVYYQEIIRKVVETEGNESFKQFLKIDFWRDYFARFGIVEMELSKSSIVQASLLLKESDCWSGCTLSMNRKCMLIGWNGMAIRSVSAWKFRHD
ncbi:hypothetical protein CDL12_04002 [Handroanthus impetiginosus]|uniref:Uncharacterized protein n=1 Tax=Handroanthus impetiginosus TaxID=429701 RepID=A0A2G9I0G7_9LAMI|nr:hypothetical protein CDL12_04002 [Handroanthus impetiginosus]